MEPLLMKLAGVGVSACLLGGGGYYLYHYSTDGDIGSTDYAVVLVDATVEEHGEAVRATGKLVFLASSDLQSDPVSVRAPLMSERTEHTTGEGRRLCESVWPQFRGQPTFGQCSAVLIGKDRVLTAAHCLKSEDDFRQAHVVFEYTLNHDWSIEGGAIEIPRQEIHAVKCVVACSHTNSSDWIVLELHQPTNRAPLDLGPDVEKGTKISALFHPLGLPLKTMSSAVEVGECAGDGFCFAPFDNGVGGSGGALLDEERKAVIGTVVGFRLGTIPIDWWPGPACVIPSKPSAGQKFVPVQQVRAGLESESPPQCKILSEFQCH